MKFDLQSKDGLTLKTKGKYVKEDIAVGLSDSDKSALVPENIVEEASVLGVQGSLKRYDGTFEGEAKAITGFADGTITEYSGQDTSVRERAFYLCQVITSIDLPNATSVGLYSFGNCINLTSINLPNATSIGESAFFKCQELTSIKLPKATTIGRQSFYYCYKLESVNLPSVTYLDRYAFGYCHSLKAVIIGQETKVCTLYDTNVFNNCYHINGTVNATYNPNGDKDGYIYVPRSMVDSYKSATNWSKYADQIRALEDYTIDGTTTGELDESKVNA